MIRPCQRSGECCRGRGRTPVSETDLIRLARHLGLGPEDAKLAYLNRDPDGFSLKCKNPVLTDAECVFLRAIPDPERAGKELPACGIYEARPEACRTWPFWDRLATDEEHYEECRTYCAMLRGASHADFRAEFLRRRR